MHQPPSSQPVTIDGKYQVVRLIGVGGMGAVYEAMHLGTGRRVAVKVIGGDASMHDADIVRRFQREAMATGAIETQHIAHVLDAGIDGETGNPYMALEYLQGEDLQQTLRRTGPLRPELALRIAMHACLGLRKAHEAEIVHRDIKPANLFLTRREAGEIIVKVVDFGVAKMQKAPLSTLEGADLTRTGAMLGSPLYMSPEQARGRKTVDARSDLWSLGVVLYEMLVGATPHSNLTSLGDLIFAICSESLRPIQDRAPWVPPEIAAIVHCAMMIDPSGRFQTAAEMGDAIRALLPSGIAIDEAMVAPIAPDLRTVVAPRFAVGSNAPPLSHSDAAAHNPHVDSTGGMSPTRAAQPPVAKRRAAPIVIASLVTALGIGSLVMAARERTRAGAAAGPASAQIVTSIVAEGASSSAPSSSSSAQAVRTVALGIAPPNVAIEIDGIPARAQAGSVPITGALGSTHRVRLSQARHEIVVDVAVAESGAVPPRIELPLPAAPVRVGTGAPHPPAAANAANNQGPSTPPPAVPSPPKPPNISRDFN